MKKVRLRMLYNRVMAVITVDQACERLSISRSRIYALIKSGRLPAHKPGRDWLIEEEDLERVRVRKPGRPWHKERPARPQTSD